MLTSSLVIASLTVPLSFYLPGGITASAAVLDAEILSNISSSNNSGTTTGARWAADGATKNVDFSITGGELAGASAITSGKKQAVLAIPNQLNGRVAVNGPAQIDTNITLTLADVPFLSGTLTAVDNLSNALTDIVQNTIGNATGVNLNLTNVNQKIAALKNIENFGSATFPSTSSLAGNGSYISANIDDGLGLVLAQDVRTILQDLKTAIDQLNATGSNIILVPVVNTALAAAKVPIDAALNLAIPLVGVGGAGINQLADASLLGSTTVNIPTTVVSPTSLSQNLDARFVGTVVKTDVIDVSLISTANGVSDIYYAGTAAVVAPPVVTNTTGTSATGYTVTGTATAGDTVTIKNAGGTTIASGPATGGNFTITIPQGAAVGDEELQAIASNGSDTSLPTTFTTPADPVVITAPTISGVTGDSATGYTVTGTATPGDSITIKNAGGAVIGSGVANGSGDFTVILLPGIATPNEILNAIASDGNGNESDPTSFTTPADAVIVPAPTVSNVTGNSATGYTVTGTATPGDNVVVKNASGIIIAAGIADPLGNFTAIIPIGLASPSEELNAIAVSGLNQSSATPFETPADAVVVPAPVVTGVTGNSSAGYTVTGTATPGDTVTVKNSGGTVLASGTADPLGQFSINLPIGSATPLESLNAIAFDGLGNQSSATPFITPPDLVIVAPPTVEGVTGSSASGYTVTGKATPGNLISIKNTGGTVVATAQADLLGNYTAVIPTGQATPNELLKAIAFDILGNQSIATNFNTPADPVLVGSPVITNVTGTSTTGYSVTGTATPGDTVLVKNTGGTVIGTGTADVNGDFTVILPIGSAAPNQQLSAIADDGNGNQSPGVPFMTPADPVVVSAPVVTGVTGSSNTGYTVTGTATPGDTVSVKNTGGTVVGSTVADQMATLL